MNILNKVTWAAMWKNRTRTIVTVIGIILSAAMFTAVTTLGVSLVGYLIECTVYNDGDYFVRYDYSTDEQLTALQQEQAVSQLGDLKALGYSTFYSLNGRSSESCIIAAGDEDFFDMVSIHMEEGRLPQSSEEIVITRNIYHYLKQSGQPCEVGEILTLDVVPEYVPEEGENDIELPCQGVAFQKSYVIVGISEYFTRLGDGELHRSHLYTRADGTENALWHRLFVKTSPPKAAYGLHGREFGMASIMNYPLLNLYGASKYVNYNHFIYAVCSVLMAIILLGSVSLIYNAFSISVSERTKQFGLLSSVGATKRQLRKSVYFEALSLSAIGVPIGILSGYLGIALTLHLTGGLVDDLMTGAKEGNIVLRAIPSVPAFLCAGMVAVVTVLISAWIPARRGTSVSPITAIRQTQDYQIPKRGIRGRLDTRKLFGLPGSLAQRYYRVSRKKYRSTVISLTVSLVLFLTAASLSAELQKTSQRNANTYNFDFEVYCDPAQAEEIRNLDFVSRTAYALGFREMTVIPDESFTEEYVEEREIAMQTWYREEPNNVKQVYLIYLDDGVFNECLKENHLDPAPYFDAENPTALVMTARYQMLTQTEDGLEMVSYGSDMLKPDVPPLTVFASGYPTEVWNFVETRIGGHRWESGMMDGMPVVEFQCTTSEVTEELVNSDPWIWPDGSIRFAMRFLDNGETGFYLVDPDTGELNSAPTATRPNTVPRPEIAVGATLDQLPFGIPSWSDTNSVTLILPLSMYEGDDSPDLLVKTDSYQKMKEYLDTNELEYMDHMAQEMQYRDMVTMVNVFSTGFIALISLICVCNVFNTIYTNIALRRRDFGMLRSVGMQTKELYRMLMCECLSYGFTALGCGLPLGLLGGYGIYALTGSMNDEAYTFPFMAVLAAVCIIFAVVLASMTYAVSRLKKDNPIDAIRMENL